MVLRKTINLPRGVTIDIDNVPENLEEIVQKAFAEYTHGTSADYTDEDRLSFIDLMIKNIHRADATERVEELIKGRFAYELEVQGHLTEPEEFLSIEFMETCYEQGQRDAKLNCRSISDDHHVYDKVNKIVARVIKAVMAWERPE